MNWHSLRIAMTGQLLMELIVREVLIDGLRSRPKAIRNNS